MNAEGRGLYPKEPENGHSLPTGRSARREEKGRSGFRKSGDLDRRAVLSLGLALAAAWLMAVLYLGLSSYVLLRARHIQALREELLRLQQENAVLEERIGERLLMVIQAVPNLGFVPAAQTEFVSP